jgi:hypothetical protein
LRRHDNILERQIFERHGIPPCVGGEAFASF